MKPFSLVAFPLLALAAGCATQPSSAETTAATADGLAAVRSSRVDQLYVRPKVDFSAYRKVLLDPVAVQLRSDFLQQRHAYNRIQPLYPLYQDAGQLARESAASVAAGLAEAFSTAGYEILTTAQPDAMRVSASVTDLFVNAPGRSSPWLQKNFSREAGQATLALEVRDAANATALMRVIHHGIAREVSASQADDVSNRMWMDAFFRRWAANCVAQISLKN
jgi:hypothetical protein